MPQQTNRLLSGELDRERRERELLKQLEQARSQIPTRAGFGRIGRAAAAQNLQAGATRFNTIATEINLLRQGRRERQQFEQQQIENRFRRQGLQIERDKSRKELLLLGQRLDSNERQMQAQDIEVMNQHINFLEQQAAGEQDVEKRKAQLQKIEQMRSKLSDSFTSFSAAQNAQRRQALIDSEVFSEQLKQRDQEAEVERGAAEAEGDIPLLPEAEAQAEEGQRRRSFVPAPGTIQTSAAAVPPVDAVQITEEPGPAPRQAPAGREPTPLPGTTGTAPAPKRPAGVSKREAALGKEIGEDVEVVQEPDGTIVHVTDTSDGAQKLQGSGLLNEGDVALSRTAFEERAQVRQQEVERRGTELEISREQLEISRATQQRLQAKDAREAEQELIAARANLRGDAVQRLAGAAGAFQGILFTPTSSVRQRVKTRSDGSQDVQNEVVTNVGVPTDLRLTLGDTRQREDGSFIELGVDHMTEALGRATEDLGAQIQEAQENGLDVAEDVSRDIARSLGRTATTKIMDLLEETGGVNGTFKRINNHWVQDPFVERGTRGPVQELISQANLLNILGGARGVPQEQRITLLARADEIATFFEPLAQDIAKQARRGARGFREMAEFGRAGLASAAQQRASADANDALQTLYVFTGLSDGLDVGADAAEKIASTLEATAPDLARGNTENRRLVLKIVAGLRGGVVSDSRLNRIEAGLRQRR